MPYQGPWDRFITFIWMHRETSWVCRVLCWLDTFFSCLFDRVEEWFEYWPNQMLFGSVVAVLCFETAGFLLLLSLTG